MNRKETLNQNGKGSDEAVYHQPLPVAMRVILVFGAGITLMAPYELLIKPGIPVFQLGMIPFWVIAGGGCLVGLVFLAAAILGYAKNGQL